MKTVIYEGVRFFDAAGVTVAELRVAVGPGVSDLNLAVRAHARRVADEVFRADTVIGLIGGRLRAARVVDVMGRHTVWYSDGTSMPIERGDNPKPETAATLPEAHAHLVAEGTLPLSATPRRQLTREEYFAAPLRPVCNSCWGSLALVLGETPPPSTPEWNAQPVYVNDEGKALVAPVGLGKVGATCARCGWGCP